MLPPKTTHDLWTCAEPPDLKLPIYHTYASIRNLSTLSGIVINIVIYTLNKFPIHGCGRTDSHTCTQACTHIHADCHFPSHNILPSPTAPVIQMYELPLATICSNLQQRDYTSTYGQLTSSNTWENQQQRRLCNLQRRSNVYTHKHLWQLHSAARPPRMHQKVNSPPAVTRKLSWRSLQTHTWKQVAAFCCKIIQSILEIWVRTPTCFSWQIFIFIKVSQPPQHLHYQLQFTQ